MRRWALALACLLGCSTDTFSGDDAGDAGDGGNDGPAIEAGKGEGGATDAGTCLNGNQTSGCGGGGWCNTSEECCANDSGAQCTTSTSCSGTSFMCRNTADCPIGDAGVFTCCLNNAVLAFDVCPRTIKGGQAACATSCSGSGYKLCSTTADCPGAKTCQRANVGGNDSITVGVCLQ